MDVAAITTAAGVALVVLGVALTFGPVALIASGLVVAAIGLFAIDQGGGT